jgi:multisubunit Na+/H+ antiporter MnhF subunit
MAFGTKYGGIFILPFLFVPALLNDSPEVTLAGKIKRRIPPFIGFFLLGWLIFNPYVIFNFIHFVRWLKLIIVYTLTGFVGSQGQIAPADPMLWFPALYRAFSPPSSLVLLAGLVPALWSLIRAMKTRESLRTPDTLNRIVIATYCLFALIHIILGVKSREIRYAFHLIPFIVLLSFVGWSVLSRWTEERGRTFLAFALLLLIAPANLNAVQSMAFCSNKESDTRLASGRILEERYAPDTRILADFYSYVPPKFRNSHIEWGIKRESILREKPLVVIINKNMTGRWIWKAPGTSFRDVSFLTSPSYRENELRGAQEVFSMLFQGKDGPYRVIYEDDYMGILELRSFSDHAKE